MCRSGDGRVKSVEVRLAGGDEPPVRTVEEGARARRRGSWFSWVAGARDARRRRDDGDEDQQERGEEPAGPAGPERGELDASGARAHSPIRSEVMRNPESTKNVSTPRKPPSHEPGVEVVGDDGRDRERAYPVEGRLIAEPPSFAHTVPPGRATRARLAPTIQVDEFEWEDRPPRRLRVGSSPRGPGRPCPTGCAAADGWRDRPWSGHTPITVAGPSGVGRTAEGQSTKRYRTRVQRAAKPSCQVIFLPSSNSRPE